MFSGKPQVGGGLDVIQFLCVFGADVAAVEDDFALKAIRILADRPPLDGEA